MHSTATHYSYSSYNMIRVSWSHTLNSSEFCLWGSRLLSRCSNEPLIHTELHHLVQLGKAWAMSKCRFDGRKCVFGMCFELLHHFSMSHRLLLNILILRQASRLQMKIWIPVGQKRQIPGTSPHGTSWPSRTKLSFISLPLLLRFHSFHRTEGYLICSHVHWLVLALFGNVT